jgi:dipeptidyl aminopeptidase/acylaminoacyl peptidase
MRQAIVLGVALLLGGTRAAAAQPAGGDGTILEQTPCPAYVAPSYDAAVASATQFQGEEAAAAQREGITMRTPLAYATPEEFEQGVTASQSITCTRIVYRSDGLKVAGLMWRPQDQGSRRLPLIIFTRGGNRDFGRIPPWHGFHLFAAEGFVVLASQYRGVDGGEGVEEFGGADVDDVRNLVPAAASLGFVDLDNVFLLGWSRGAMEALLALKQGLRVNAIAIGGGLLDLVAEAERRPTLVTNVWSKLIPQFASRREAALRERSAMYWPEAVTAPILVLHGGGDWRASPVEAMTFAQKLHAAGRVYELVVYANDDHAISANRIDRNRRIVEWFKAHLQ